MESIAIKTVGPNDPDLRALTARLDRELLALYPADGVFGVDLDDPKSESITFCVAYAGGSPVGCGALRLLGAGQAELKRFFVEKDHRGRGIASSLLSFVEDRARAAGVAVLKLETGPRQPDAIGLYGKFGYEPCALFGEYTDSRYSFCMEKHLL